jgi:spore maturation protein SpmA/spore maturation protein SpmB
MLNRLWVFFVVIAAMAGITQSFLTGGATVNAMGNVMFSSARTGLEMSIGLASALALWLGLFEVAEAAGLVAMLARVLAPVLRRLMPEVPPDHPALGSIGMNVAMSMLGVDDGALPSGLKAMQELETLNPSPGTASRAQQMLLVYMTTSVTIFPISILGYRMQAGAAHPADVFLPLLLASYAGLFSGLLYMAVVQRIRLRDPVLFVSAALLVSALSGAAWVIGTRPSGDIGPIVALLGNSVLLFSVVLSVVFAWWRGVLVYDAFLKGAAKGFGMAVDLIPYIVGMLLVIGLLRTSGAFVMLQQALAWACNATGLDASWALGVPQGVMKAFSGGGARAIMLDTFKIHGPDSFVGHLSAIIQGASDTTFYILAACAGAAQLKNLGSAVTGAVVASLASFVVAVVCAHLFFG